MVKYCRYLWVHLCFLYLLLALQANAKEAAGEEKQKRELSLLHAGSLLTHANQPPLTDVSVVIEDGTIQQVSKGFLSIDELDNDGQEINVTLIDLKDRFVLPGLIDSHVHLQIGNNNKKGPSELTDADLAFSGAQSARSWRCQSIEKSQNKSRSFGLL